MAKTIVLCLDGTNNEYGERNTNVVRLFELLDKRDPTQLVAFYDPGIGTFSPSPVLNAAARTVMKGLGMAFGLGMTANLKDAYRFLMNTYVSGDEVFIFGFSRGAYTARVLAGLLHVCGLLPRGNDNLVDYAVRLYTGRKFEVALGDENMAGFKKTFARPCAVRFLGLWDTVASVGWIYSPKTYPFTARPEGVGTIRHAVSVDERRAHFRQNRVKEHPDLREVWFPGVHSDVGGGYPPAENHLARISLEWMLIEARRCGLPFDIAQALDAVAAERPLSGPRFTVHDSLSGLWNAAELFPKIRWSERHRLYLPHVYRWRSRSIEDHEIIHESLFHKMEDDPLYQPRNVPTASPTEPWGRLAQ